MKDLSEEVVNIEHLMTIVALIKDHSTLIYHQIVAKKILI